MAAAAHISARIYGEIEGNLPYQDATGLTAFSRIKPWPSPKVVSFPTNTTTYTTLNNGVLVSNSYVYSVIEEIPSGLNTHGKKYVTDTSAATLATNAG